jgi:hypothetical protein
MSETPDMFREYAGVLIPISGESRAASGPRTVRGQMAGFESPTNLSGGVESRHAGQRQPVGASDGDRSSNMRPAGESKPASGSSAPPAQNNFCGSTSAAMPCDNRRMAATVEEGTAPKPVQVNAGANVRRPNSGNEIGRDSRRDGTFSGQGAGLIAPKPEQLVRVRELMRDGKERTLAEISEITGDPEASVSARLRDLRRPKYGLWTVRRKRIGSLYYYQLRGKGL